jgi:hypothetical protein
MTLPPFLIVPREELGKLFENREVFDTGFLCQECFTPVQHVTDKGFTTCRCSCYARIFNDLQKVRQLTSEVWLDYIEHSSSRKCLSAAEHDPLINPARGPNYDCWCPHCGRDRKLGAKVIWVSPHETYVCTYGTCLQCARTMQGLSEADRTAKGTLCEDRLLQRYPFLHSRLPS